MLYCEHWSYSGSEHAYAAKHLRVVENSEKRPVTVRRLANSAYRTREHLTPKEMAVLLDTLKGNRHGHRDWLIGLLIYRHGLRVSEACDLRWDDIDFAKRTIMVRRLKGSHDSTHYLERDELTGLKQLQNASRDGCVVPLPIVVPAPVLVAPVVPHIWLGQFTGRGENRDSRRDDWRDEFAWFPSRREFA